MPSNELQPTALASWYQGESLEAYLNAMFHYYEAEDKASSVTNEVRSVDVEECTAIPSSFTPFKQAHKSLFETILAKCGLRLSDATFEEIIQGDYYSVLRRYGLIESSNNPSFVGLGGVV